ncbi:MAG: flagellar FlbD family protein [Firmicutes bacterium]|nr:flagellar FlbD family protein [Bacillota bacterium]HOB21889.1 flagellar FlbD family protein [Bacillota bacterium]HQD40689.1 flagellar FlbD family protein [Bacillota bacterium]
MISVTRLDGKEIVVNAFLIELVEATPDTVLSLTTGRKVLVREQVTEVVERARVFFQEVGSLRYVPTQPQNRE